MSDPDINKLPPERLTLSGSRNTLIFSCCLAILFVVIGLVQLKYGTKLYAVGFCLAALGQSFNVPSKWKDYPQVRQGIEVYTPAQTETAPLTLAPKSLSVAVVLILSGFVGVSSLLIIFAAHTVFNTLIGWIVAIGILSFLWLLTAHFWYRILTEKPWAEPVLVQEQPEGVWPPAPYAAAEEDNKD